MKDIILALVGSGFFIGLMALLNLLAAFVLRFRKRTVTAKNLKNLDELLSIMQIIVLYTPIAYGISITYNIWYVDILCVLIYFLVLYVFDVFLREGKLYKEIQIMILAFIQMVAVVAFVLFFPDSLSHKAETIIIVGLVLSFGLFTWSRVKLYKVYQRRQLKKGCCYWLWVDSVTQKSIKGYINIGNGEIWARLPKQNAVGAEPVKNLCLQVVVVSLFPLRIVFKGGYNQKNN